MKISDLLVPIDFSEGSLRALDFALSLVEPGGEICLLHVIDSDFVTRIEEEGLGKREEVQKRMREEAERQLVDLAKSVSSPKPELTSMVVIGKPFSEILRVATDLDYQMIAIGRYGRPGTDLEKFLFGSTAEKVIRGAQIPVVSVPADQASKRGGEV